MMTTEATTTETVQALIRVLDSMPQAERTAMIGHIADRVDQGDHVERIAQGVSIEWSSFGVTADMVRAIVLDPT